MNILPQNKRDWLGVIGWFAAGLILNLLALIPMVLREVYQKKKYPYNPFEWEDVVRYSIAIAVGGVVQWLLVKYVIM